MVELKKWHTSIAKYFHNFGTYRIVEILKILHNILIVLRNQDGNVFYINNYIDWNQFNQSYTPNWMKKRKLNAKTVVRKFKSALTETTN